MQLIKDYSLISELIERFSSLKKVDNYTKVIVDGPKCFKKLLNSNLKIHEILTNDKYFHLLDESRLSQTKVFLLKQEDLELVVGHKVHQGIIAIADAPKIKNIKMLSGPVICLNGLTSPENVGSIIRTASAFNLNNILVDHKTVHPFSRRCIRVSMGNVFNINVGYSQNLKQDLESLKNKYRIIATANEKNASEISKTRLPYNSLIIIGSEGHGIDTEILETAHTLSKIPITDSTLHLNASISAAIYMYELSRR